MIERYLELTPNVHPEAWVHPTVAVLGDVTVARGATLWPYVVARGDQGAVVIGEDTNIQDLTMLHATGGISTVTVGARVTVGHRVTLHGARVGDDCLIGMGSILLDNCEIGDWCVIGAGALIPVGMKVPPRSLVLGMPGRIVRQINDKDVERIQKGHRTYLELAAGYRATRR